MKYLQFLNLFRFKIIIFIEKHTTDNFQELKGDISLGLSKAGATGATITVFYQWMKQAEQRQLDFGDEELPLKNKRIEVIFSRKQFLKFVCYIISFVRKMS